MNEMLEDCKISSDYENEMFLWTEDDTVWSDPYPSQ